jgi:hypothetical protein
LNGDIETGTSMRIRATLLLTVVTLVLVSAAPAFAAIKILRIEYDPPGPNTGTNRNVNEEFVVLENRGSRNILFRGWRLRDASKRPNRYLFADTFRLAAGKRVRIHSGRGDDDRNDLYWGFDSYIWKNGGDTAVLRDDSGGQADRCQYSGRGTSPVMC